MSPIYRFLAEFTLFQRLFGNKKFSAQVAALLRKNLYFYTFTALYNILRNRLSVKT